MSKNRYVSPEALEQQTKQKKQNKILFILLFLYACSDASIRTEFLNKEDYIELKVCSNSTKAELNKIKGILENRGIQIEFSKSTFGFTGGLDRLDLEIKTDDGFYAHIIGDFSLDQKYFGFYRDFQEGTNNLFYFGQMN